MPLPVPVLYRDRQVIPSARPLQLVAIVPVSPDELNVVQEHEHVASLPHGSRLNHQLSSLRNCHEVANDLRMGNGNGSTLANLLTE